MYNPVHFREERLTVLHQMMRRHPLAALVTCSPAGLVANHIPLLIDSTRGAMGTLRGHLARANTQWETMHGEAALAIFTGPECYVSPSLYPTKSETGRVVPTWNYVAVHAAGKVRVIEDSSWLLELVTELTAVHESARPDPWEVSDAPAEYIQGLLRAIVGIEMEITSLEGKWKASQNRSRADRAGVAEGLRGHPMSGIVQAGRDNQDE